MARPSSVWYWDARKCWATTVNGKRYTAPRSIGPKDQLGALTWHKSIVEGSMPVTVGNLRVADLCELYLAWDEKRVSANQRDSRSHDLTVIKLTRVCATVVDGVKVGKLPATSIERQHLETSPFNTPPVALSWEQAMDYVSPHHRGKDVSTIMYSRECPRPR
ncbi:MAG: hypothetical protein ACLP53_28665, partial [Isosphaeraceae bacterium]